MTTKVIFRKFKDNGDVIALFPELVNPYNRLCESHMHGDGNSGANYSYLIDDATLPAKPEEYAPLLAELKTVGYADLAIRSRYIRSKGSTR